MLGAGRGVGLLGGNKGLDAIILLACFGGFVVSLVAGVVIVIGVVAGTAGRGGGEDSWRGVGVEGVERSELVSLN